MNAHGNTHEHMLRTLGNLAIDLEHVRPLQRLESEKVVVEIAVIDDGRVQAVGMRLDDAMRLDGNHGRGLSRLWVDVGEEVVHDGGKLLLGLLVQVADGDTRGKNGIVRVLDREARGCLGGKVVQLDRGHTLVDAGNDLIMRRMVFFASIELHEMAWPYTHDRISTGHELAQCLTDQPSA